MKKIKLLVIFILISLSTLVFTQSLRTIKTDAIAPNATGGNIEITAPVIINSSSVTVDDVLDEDDLASDSPTALVTQQSIKAYVDAGLASVSGLGDVDITGAVANDMLVWDGTNWVNRSDMIFDTATIGAVLPSSAIFNVASTTKGSRPCPAMTEVQRGVIGTPATGLCVFNTTSAKLNVYNGTGWVDVGGGGGISAWLTATVYAIGDVIHNNNLVYLALTNHTSGTFATDLGNNEWIQLSDYSDASNVQVYALDSVTNVFNRINNQGIFRTISLTDDGGLAFSWSTGTIYDITTKLPVEINAGSASCTNNAVNYLYWDSTATLTLSTTKPAFPQVRVATIGCQDGDIVFLHQEEALNTREAAITHGLEELFPVAVAEGVVVSEDTDVTNVWDVAASAGEYYLDAHKEITTSSLVSRTTAMVRHYKVAGAWDSDTNAQINTTQYNNGTNLAAVVAAQYYKSCFYVASDSRIHWVYPTTGHVQLADAIADACPTLPPGLREIAPSSALVLRGNATAFPASTSSQWIDIRPMFGTSTGGSGVSEFTLLTDTPATFVSSAGYMVRVNAGESALEFFNWLTGTVTFTNKTFDDPITMQTVATPANPAAGYMKIYPKADGYFYTLTSAGVETQIAAGAGATNFLALTDTPAAYTGAALDIVRVNAGVSALEFVDNTSDIFTQYALLAGRSGGQTLIGGTAASNDLTLSSTSNATKGAIVTADRVEIGKDVYAKAGVFSYITNSNAERDTTGWAGYNDGSVAAPVNGTGGSLTDLSFARNTTGPLRGLADFLITKSANDAQGEGVSYDFSIDTGDQATVQTINFQATTSANYADNDIGIYVYDVTNSVLLASVPVNLIGGTNGKFAASFQTSYNSTSYRLIFHVQSTNAAAYTVQFDNVQVNDQKIVNGAPVTPWEAYVPTVSGLGTISSSEMYYRRVGDSVEVKGYVQAGTVVASEVQIGLPAGLTIDTTKNASVTTVGFGSSTVAAASQYVMLGTGGDTYFNVGFQDASHSGLTPLNGNDILTNNSYISFFAKVPVAGWSSGVVMSETMMNKEILSIAAGNAGQSVTATSGQIPFITVSNSAGSGWDGTKFTAPETGTYDFNGLVYVSAANSSLLVNMNKNGSYLRTVTAPASSTSVIFELNGTVVLQKNDYIDFRFNQTITVVNDAGLHHMTIKKSNVGSQTMAASESVYASGAGNGSTVCTANVTNIDFTETSDSHGAWSGSIFTAPASGRYLLTGMVRANASSAYHVQVYVNTVANVFAGVAETSSQVRQLSATLRLNQGDTVSLRASAGITLDNVTTSHYFSIDRI